MTMRNAMSASLAATFLTVALAACSGAGTGASASGGAGGPGMSPPAPPAGPGSTPATTPGGQVTGHVGNKLTFPGTEVDLGFDATLVKVFDPATPTSASTQTLPSGARWVGVEVIIDNHSTHAGDDSSALDGGASDGTVLAVDGTYKGSARPIGAFQGCTETEPFSHTDVPYTLCKAFVVPDGQTLVRVGFNATQLGQADQVTWAIP